MKWEQIIKLSECLPSEKFDAYSLEINGERVDKCHNLTLVPTLIDLPTLRYFTGN